jgi:modulator of FtsH protease
MSGWESFVTAQVGASATLAGLIFVGLSINLTKIVNYPGLTGRTVEGLAMLMAVLFVSSLLLVPEQPLPLIGAEVLVVGLIVWAAIVLIQLKNLRQLQPPQRPTFPMRVLLGQLATLPFVIAGIMVLTQGGTGLYWIVPAVLFSFFGALLDAWVLLVEINR